MLCHYLKHISEFSKSSSYRNTLEDANKYFREYSQLIFKDQNEVVEKCVQDGNLKIINYISNFGLLTHVGFAFNAYETYDRVKKITSHFIKENGRISS